MIDIVLVAGDKKDEQDRFTQQAPSLVDKQVIREEVNKYRTLGAQKRKQLVFHSSWRRQGSLYSGET